MAHDHLNVPLVDVELLEEVRLLTDLIIAATDATGPLGKRSIDQVLGSWC